MKYFPSLFGFFLGAFLLTSCSSKRDENGDLLFGLTGNPNNPEQVTKILTKVISTDADGDQTTVEYNYVGGQLASTRTVDEDGEQNLTLLYENQALSEIKGDYTETGSTDKLTYDYKFQYVGSQIMSANGEISDPDEGILNDNAVFTYNPSGTLSNLKTTVSKKATAEVLSETDQNYAYTASNLTSWKSKIVQYIGGNPAGTLNSEIAFSDFDDKKNPFATLPFSFLMAGSIPYLDANITLGFSRNNARKQVLTTSVPPADTQNFTFTYDTDGYPAIATADDGTIIKFEYKKL